jgi:hypothetical protein
MMDLAGRAVQKLACGWKEDPEMLPWLKRPILAFHRFIERTRNINARREGSRVHHRPYYRRTEEVAGAIPLQRPFLRADAWNQFAPLQGAIVPRSASPFAPDAFRRARMDWSAMSEHGRVEAKRGDLALAASSFFDILKSYWIAELQDVRADIACDQ